MNICRVCATRRYWALCWVRRSRMKASFHWERGGWWAIWVRRSKHLTLSSQYRYRSSTDLGLLAGGWGESRGRSAAAIGNVLQVDPPGPQPYPSALRGSLPPKELQPDAMGFAKCVKSTSRVWG